MHGEWRVPFCPVGPQISSTGIGDGDGRAAGPRAACMRAGSGIGIRGMQARHAWRAASLRCDFAVGEVARCNVRCSLPTRKITADAIARCCKILVRSYDIPQKAKTTEHTLYVDSF